MGHRAKHRIAALASRAAQGHTIKTDLLPDGTPNAAYQVARAEQSAPSTKARGGKGFRDIFQMDEGRKR